MQSIKNVIAHVDKTMQKGETMAIIAALCLCSYGALFIVSMANNHALMTAVSVVGILYGACSLLYAAED